MSYHKGKPLEVYQPDLFIYIRSFLGMKAKNNFLRAVERCAAFF